MAAEHLETAPGAAPDREARTRATVADMLATIEREEGIEGHARARDARLGKYVPCERVTLATGEGSE